MTVSARVIELVVLYGIGPLLVAWAVQRYQYRAPIAPLLWVLSIVATWVLSADPTFDTAALWSWPDEPVLVTAVGLRLLLLGGALLWLGRHFAPDDFMALARQKPLVWLALIVLYPLLSALPQGLLWRVLFVQRYAALFDSRIGMICAGALAFSLGHITYRSARALAITAVGGGLFLDTYLRSHSMLLAAAEHGALGSIAFSAGLGRFLRMGRRWRVGGPAEAGERVVASKSLPRA